MIVIYLRLPFNFMLSICNSLLQILYLISSVPLSYKESFECQIIQARFTHYVSLKIQQSLSNPK